MTLDEAIEERLKVIKVQEKLYEESYSDESKEIIKSAIDNDRQLAEWLRELKEAKRLLKMAVESLRWLALHTEDSYGSCVIRDDNAHNKCDNCPLDNPEYTDCKWEYEAEALKLMGETNDEP